MVKEFNVRDKVFIPAKITAVIGGGHYKAEFFVSNDEVKTESFNANVGTLFTAKQVSDKYIDGPTYDDLKTERDTLKMMLAERDRLLASANADITTLKSENERLSEQNEELGARAEELTDLNQRIAEKYELLRAQNADLERENLTYRETTCRHERKNQELAKENGELMAVVDELKDTLSYRIKDVQHLAEENDKLKAERDKFSKTAKDKADTANKACDERYDARVDLVTARAAINHLQEENKKLKQELKDAEVSYNVVADTSLERKNRITTMEEVIVALVEKIRRLEGGD